MVSRAAAVGAAVRNELSGATATTVTINNEELDVVVMGDGTAAESLDALRSMPVSTAMGGYVPLSAVAQVEVIQAPQSIQRVNQSRQVTISGDTISGNTAAMTEPNQCAAGPVSASGRVYRTDGRRL